VITYPEAEAIRDRACGHKPRLGQDEARRRAAAYNRNKTEEGRPLAAYRCCFCGSWHTGHLLSEEGMETMAQAIRVLAQELGKPAASLTEKEGSPA
jgi:hypothetical protein